MIRVVHGSVLDVEVDAVIRPVRSDLAPINTMSRDLATRAGPMVDEHLDRLGSLPLGGAVITPGGDLPVDYLIHAVVMSEDEPQTSATVRKAVGNSLGRATDWGIGSLALPPLGIGVGLSDPEISARVLVEVLLDHIDEGASPLELTIVVSSQYESDLFTHLVEELTADRG